MTKIHVIGDVHGQYTKYRKYIDQLVQTYPDELTFQLGDFGFSYNTFKGLDINKHIFIGGNHDNYDIINDCLNCLGDFGIWNEIFYMRGAWSIDRQYRTPCVDWWETEELSNSKMLEAFELYKQIKPKIVITHEAPEIAAKIVLDSLGLNLIKTRTNQILQQMFEYHQPQYWYFGHYHTAKVFLCGITNFHALSEFPDDGSVKVINTRIM